MFTKKNVRLLVVDDSKKYSEIIQEWAETSPPEYNLTFEFADSEAKTIEAINRWDPSVVLMDAHMPCINTFEVLERYLAGAVPVIVTSGTRSKAIEDSAREKGAVGYFAKSENPDELEFLLNSIGSVSIEFATKH